MAFFSLVQFSNFFNFEHIISCKLHEKIVRNKIASPKMFQHIFENIPVLWKIRWVFLTKIWILLNFEHINSCKLDKKAFWKKSWSSPKKFQGILENMFINIKNRIDFSFPIFKRFQFWIYQFIQIAWNKFWEKMTSPKQFQIVLENMTINIKNEIIIRKQDSRYFWKYIHK